MALKHSLHTLMIRKTAQCARYKIAHRKLTHRHYPTLVASESPHDSSPLRGKSYAFGQTDLQPSSVFTPAGQRIRAVYSPPAALLRIICKSYIENRPSYMSSCLAAAWGRLCVI